MIQKPKGTKDILPNEIYKWQYIEKVVSELFQNYSFKEIRIPVFEHTELFLRGVGETTDVVQKEMYTFLDKGERSITLRPEGTAGAVRAYIENGMSSLPSPIKLWYNITAYRYENVQKGRYREFRQLGAEVIGSSSYLADAELIMLATQIFKKLNIPNIKLEINSIGCPTCRASYQKELKKYVQEHIEDYCDDCKQRLEKNPMRILDCKNEKCKSRNENAPIILEHLCEECNTHFNNLTNLLDKMEYKYIINPRIVRGLDYYTKTVFEFIDDTLGLTVLAGGRYDGLVKELEGQDTPAVGFAMGEDRLIEIFDKYNNEILTEVHPRIYIATIGEETQLYATKLVQDLRSAGILAEKDINEKSVKAQFKYADKIHAKYVMTLGEEEIKKTRAKLKNMQTGEEEEIEISVNNLIGKLS